MISGYLIIFLVHCLSLVLGEDCKNTVFGCCSSNSSLPAHGSHGEGCCLESGCCQDYQQSSSNSSCLCQDSALGCCPDGVTSRWSRDDDGCGCRYSMFGCCQDQHTAAQGRTVENIALQLYSCYLRT